MEKLHIFVPHDAIACAVRDAFDSATVTPGSFKSQQGSFVTIPVDDSAVKQGTAINYQDLPTTRVINTVQSVFSLSTNGPAFPPDLQSVTGLQLGQGETVWPMTRALS